MIAIFQNRYSKVFSSDFWSNLNIKRFDYVMSSQTMFQELININYEYLIIDISILSDAYTLSTWEKMKEFIHPSRVILYADPNKFCDRENFLLNIIQMGFPNIALSGEEVIELFNSPRSYLSKDDFLKNFRKKLRKTADLESIKVKKVNDTFDVIYRVITGFVIIPLISILSTFLFYVFSHVLESLGLYTMLANVSGYINLVLCLMVSYFGAVIIHGFIESKTLSAEEFSVTSSLLFSGLVWTFPNILQKVEQAPIIINSNFMEVLFSSFLPLISLLVSLFLVLYYFSRKGFMMGSDSIGLICTLWLIYAALLPAISYIGSMFLPDGIADVINQLYNYPNSRVVLLAGSYILGVLSIIFSNNRKEVGDNL